MGAKSLFDKPFDDGTKAKLSIYENYLEKWLPVFVARQEIIWNKIQIFDFFSGMGKDENGIPGSPLITIKLVNSYCSYIKDKGLKVSLVFNELNNDYYNSLKENISKENLACNFSIEVYNKPFKELFDELFPSMEKSANFIFLDQNGIKEITHSVFSKIISLKQTDFLFFISSSYFKRFAKTPEFNQYFNFNENEIDTVHYYHIHRKVVQHYQSLIPHEKNYYLAPFSIRKGNNIYGLVFGTPHTFGIEKFLSVAWKIDPLTGEANYDIDKEKISSESPFLFADMNIPTKRQVFEADLKEKIISAKLTTDWEVYHYTLEEGFLLKDANVVLKSLKGNGKIDFDFKLIVDRLHKIIIPSEIKIK